MTEPRTGLQARLGYRGPVVRHLRDSLTAAGALRPAATNGAVNGTAEVFDDELDAAVRSFQQERGLLVDGIVGPWTYAALDAAKWQLGDRLLRHSPGHLVRGDDVTELQERLLGLGFHPGRIDGLFGPDTEAAVRGFQRGVGLDVDGEVGPATLRAFTDLRRSVAGGSSLSLREREHVRRSGHSLGGRTIVLDPGHGGDDPGAVAHGIVEAEIVHDLAGRIEGRLSAHVPTSSTRGPGSPAPGTTRRAPTSPTTAALTSSCPCTATPPTSRTPAASPRSSSGRRFGAWSAVGEQPPTSSSARPSPAPA